MRFVTWKAKNSSLSNFCPSRRKSTSADPSLGCWPATITCFFSDRKAYSIPSLALRRAGLPSFARVNRRVTTTNYRVVDPYQSMEQQPSRFFRVHTNNGLCRFRFPKGHNPLLFRGFPFPYRKIPWSYRFPKSLAL